MYVYKCPNCLKQIELLRKFSEADDLPRCSTCLPEACVTMEKVLASSTFILNGGGWAKDGYK